MEISCISNFLFMRYWETVILSECFFVIHFTNSGGMLYLMDLVFGFRFCRNNLLVLLVMRGSRLQRLVSLLNRLIPSPHIVVLSTSHVSGSSYITDFQGGILFYYGKIYAARLLLFVSIYKSLCLCYLIDVLRKGYHLH